MYGNRNGKFSQTNMLSYIMLTVFIIFDVISVIATAIAWFTYNIISSYSDGLSTIGKIIFIIIIYFIIYIIPTISIIIQFFCNTNFFKVQLIVLCYSIIITNVFLLLI